MSLLLINFPVLSLFDLFYPLICFVDFLVINNLYILSFTYLLAEFAEGFGVMIILSGLIFGGFTFTSTVLSFNQYNKSFKLKLVNAYNILNQALFKSL